MRRCMLALLCGGAAGMVPHPLGFTATDSVTGRQHVVKTSRKPFVTHEEWSIPVEHPILKDVTKTHYKGPDITLKKGEAWFTLPDVSHMAMPDPGVPFAIVSNEYDIVDQTGRSVPLSELYSHHWLVYNNPEFGTGCNVGCGCEKTWTSNIYGAGGEMRGIDYTYTSGYGWISPKPMPYWSANIHFIRTEDLSTQAFNGSIGEATKSCIECGYVPGKAPECLPFMNGEAIFACCFDGSQCPVNNPTDTSTKVYNLVYNITWTKDIANVKSQDVYVLDVFDCGILDNVGPNNKKAKGTTCDDTLCVSKVTQTFPDSGTLMWAYGHQHLGAINSSLEVNGVHKCGSYPRWGTDPNNAPGNEKGYAVGFDMCVDPQKPETFLHLSKGDKLTYTTYYSVDPADTTSLPIPGGTHTGVMGLFYMALYKDPPVPGDRFHCDTSKLQCVSSTEGHSTLAKCQEACNPAPVPPAPSPPAPAPTPPATMYKCTDGKCVAASPGVPLATCQAACG